MKNIFLLTLAFFTFCNTYAQRYQRVRRIQDVTEYNQLTRDGQLLKTISELTSSAPVPGMGSPKIPVILVQFSDRKFSIADTDDDVAANYQQFFNAEEGVQPGQTGHESACSVKEYFRQQSSGKFTPEFTIIGPVTVSKSYTYYGDNGTRGDGADINISSLYKEACKLAVTNFNVDWSLFDNKNNGKVSFVFFIYAGVGENISDDTYTIWPKESKSSLKVSYDENKSITFSSYGCTSELHYDGQDGIGPTIHELGHGLGFPDFYDTNYQAFGMDLWSIMDSGCYTMNDKWPICMNAYERDFMGWEPLIELDPDQSYTLTLDPISEGGKGYKIPNKSNSNEYIILENRQNTGLDTHISNIDEYYEETYGNTHGLLVIHVDYQYNAWVNNRVNNNLSHQRFTIIAADQDYTSNCFGYTYDWAQSIHNDLYPGPNNITEITSYKAFTGGNFTFTIDNIRETTDGKIHVDINGGDPNSIVSPLSESASNTEIYSFDGRRLSSLQRGLNIVKTTTGKKIKILGR